MLKPLHNNVILEKEEVEKKTASGIILSDATKETPSIGKVVAVGEGLVDDKGILQPVKVKINDRVVYKKYATTEFKFKDKEYLIVSEKDILAIIE